MLLYQTFILLSLIAFDVLLSCGTSVPPSTEQTTTTQKLSTTPIEIIGENCGINKYNNSLQFGPSIAGGTDTLVNQYPWIVRVIAQSEGVWFHLCGGTIISESYVLTAAHCVGLGYENYSVIVGDHSSLITESSQNTVAIVQAIQHPQYDSNAITYDFALLKLQGTPENVPSLILNCLIITFRSFDI